MSPPGGQGDDLRDELNKLRDWRHQSVSPFLIAAEARIKLLERRMDLMEPEVDRLARAEDIAKAIRENLWTTAQKAGAAFIATLIAVSAVLGVVLQLVH